MSPDMDGASPAPANQTPEQIARDTIDAQLRASGWAAQAKDAIDFHAGEDQARLPTVI